MSQYPFSHSPELCSITSLCPHRSRAARARYVDYSLSAPSTIALNSLPRWLSSHTPIPVPL